MSKHKELSMAIQSGELDQVIAAISADILAAKKTHPTTIPQFLNRNSYWGLEYTVQCALQCGNIEIMKYIFSLLDKEYLRPILENDNFSAVETLASRGKTEMIIFLENSYPNLYKHKTNQSMQGLQSGTFATDKKTKKQEFGAFYYAALGGHCETMKYLDGLYKKNGIDILPEFNNAIIAAFKSSDREKRKAQSSCIEKFCQENNYDIKEGLICDNYLLFSYALTTKTLSNEQNAFLITQKQKKNIEDDFKRLKEITALYDKYNLLDDALRSRFKEFLESFRESCSLGDVARTQFHLELCNKHANLELSNILVIGFNDSLKNDHKNVAQILLCHAIADKSIPDEIARVMLVSTTLAETESSRLKLWANKSDEAIIEELSKTAEKTIQIAKGKNHYFEEIMAAKSFVKRLEPEKDEIEDKHLAINFITTVKKLVGSGASIQIALPILERIFSKELASDFSNLHYALKDEFLRTGLSEINSTEKVIKTIDHDKKLEELELKIKRTTYESGTKVVSAVRKIDGVFFRTNEKELAENAAKELNKVDDRKNYTVLPIIFEHHKRNDFSPFTFSYADPRLQTSVTGYSVLLQNKQQETQIRK